MRVLTLLSLLILCSYQVSCGGSDKRLLSIETRFKNVVVIDAPGRSCTLQQTGAADAEDDLSPLKALIGSVRIKWDGEEDLEVIYIRLKFMAAGGADQVIMISGAELGRTLIGNTSGRVIIPSHAELDSNDACNLEVGGINLADKTRTQFGQGSILIYGVTSKGEQQIAVQGQSFFNFQFDGIDQ
jgi:hypothetical protein